MQPRPTDIVNGESRDTSMIGNDRIEPVQTKPGRASSSSPSWFCTAVVAFATLNVVFLTIAALGGSWIFDRHQRIVPVDFVSFWTTGRMLQTGPAAEIYDWVRHRAAEIELMGDRDTRRYLWHNPPVFLLAVAPLAFLPYATAYVAWLGATFAAYAATIRLILPHIHLPRIVMGAVGFPGSLWTAVTGQNGFLTAALFGGTLLLIDKRPIAAGILLGLLTYKPQFGILFPLVLVATGRWMVFGAAALTTLVLFIVTASAFGFDTWIAFWRSIAVTQKAILADGIMGTNKLQSFYGVALWSTGSTMVAWTIQALVTTASAAGALWAWRSEISPDLKAAAMGIAVLLATPYILIYDLPVLSIPMAFLIRFAGHRGVSASDAAVLVTACVLVFIFPMVMIPTGLLAQILVAGLVIRHVLDEHACRSAPTAVRLAG